MQSLIPLDSREGTVIFIRALIKCRQDFPKHGGHENALEIIVRRKLVNMNICSSIEQLRSKRKNLLGRHKKNTRDGKTDHEFHVPCCVINGTLSEAAVKGTEFDPDGIIDSTEPDNAETIKSRQLLKFCKGEGLHLPCSKSVYGHM